MYIYITSYHQTSKTTFVSYTMCNMFNVKLVQFNFISLLRNCWNQQKETECQHMPTTASVNYLPTGMKHHDAQFATPLGH